jgi:ribosomal protein S11
MQESENQRIGDYEILGTLGAGGMGRVYRVRHVISDRVEAMKILLPDLAGRKELAERFLREIKLVGSLNHPNIASLCTALTVDNQLIMVMEYVDGVTLTDLLSRGPIAVPDAMNYLDQALAALGYAHGKGIVHRDIKPANIMLMSNGTIKLMDFGIARASTERAMTQTGTTLGSIDYMSPEQITGQPVDARSDIYSIGVSLYEMVTGQRPFKGVSDFELMAAHVNQPPRPAIEIQPWLPTRLNEILMQSIAKSPDNRFQSAQAMRDALRTVYGGNSLPDTQAGRAATMIELRSETIIEARPATMVRNAEASGRGMTQVSGTPVYSPSVALAVRPSALVRHRKLLVGCGSVLALAAVGVPVYMARENPGNSADSNKPAVVAPVSAPAAKAPAVVPLHASPKAPHAVVAHAPAAMSAHAAVPGRLSAKASGQVAVAPPAPVPKQTAPAESAQLKDQLDQLEVRIDGLSSRAAAVNNSLNNMQRSMQKDGMALRGDMVAKQDSMNTELAKAKQALATRDADRAQRFADLTETDVSALEKFLGR